MSHIKQQVKLVTAMLATLACLLPLATASSGQSLGTKTVHIDRQTRMDPVTIEKITIGDQLIQPGVATAAREDKPGTPFQADEDWLKNMSMVLRNRTDKVIVRAEIQLFFPDTGNGNTPPGRISPTVTAYIIALGQLPDWATYRRDGSKLSPEPTKQPLCLAPGQTLVIRLADYTDAIQPIVEEKVVFSQITTVNIRRLGFYFADGLRWEDIGYSVPDPNHPGRYTNLGPRYFPGHPSQNWPPVGAPFEPATVYGEEQR